MKFTMNFVFAQILGVVVTIICIVMTHFKKMGIVLLSELAANLLTSFQYFLLGGISGSYLCIVASVHTAVLAVFNKYCKTNVDVKRRIIFLVFVCVYLVIAVLMYRSWIDICSVASSVLFSFAVIQTKSSRYRILNLMKTFLLIVYDVYTNAFTNILNRIFTLASCGMAIVRLDLKK